MENELIIFKIALVDACRQLSLKNFTTVEYELNQLITIAVKNHALSPNLSTIVANKHFEKAAHCQNASASRGNFERNI